MDTPNGKPCTCRSTEVLTYLFVGPGRLRISIEEDEVVSIDERLTAVIERALTGE